MMIFQTLLFTVSLAAYVQAHAEPATPFANHPAEVSRRQLETNKRHVLARNCASQVASYHKNRKAKRALRRRDLANERRRTTGCADHKTRTSAGITETTISRETQSSTEDETTREGFTSTTSAVAPHYSTIQNVSPSSASSTFADIHRLSFPYYLRDDYVRQDLREGQKGTTLHLDVGVLDMATCQPATDAFVEIWACNAQGIYSAFPIGPAANDTTGVGSPPNVTTTATDTLSASDTVSLPLPTGGWPTSPKTTGDNFLRGGYAVDENGMVELTTIYPGFYTGRTIHIHTMIHQNLSYHANGTIISASGKLRHLGQIFFDEALNTEVLAQDAYLNSTQSHTSNSQDWFIEQANAGGYNAFADIERLGDTLDDGLLGYITIGIDTTASYNITTTNYWDPDFGSEISE